MRNQVQLITYVDRLSGSNIKALHELLLAYLKNAIGGVHILPFFDPIDGVDAGFDPIDHKSIDPRLGGWEDIKRLGEDFEIMADLIVNHVSADSQEFQDLINRHQESDYKDFFLTKGAVFGDASAEDTIAQIYRPRPGLPFSKKQFANGSEELFWTTFTPDQIDIDVHSTQGKSYLSSILEKYAVNGIQLIRLDAVGYAVKKPGTSCFMIPETFDFISDLALQAHGLGIEVLVEIHSHYEEQIEVAKQVDYVYDFALPPLILHGIYSNSGHYLQKWLSISPRNAITVLDTHDGIGVIDIGPEVDGKKRPGLIPNKEVDLLVKEIHKRSNGQSAQATGDSASNLDLYQVNCTYYDALGQDDELYILARAIQFYAPGVPQVYYMGLLVEPNDMKLLESTGIGRNINRHYFPEGDVVRSMEKEVVKRLIHLMKYRNSQPAFNGDFAMQFHEETLTLFWSKGEHSTSLVVDFQSLTFKIIDLNKDQVQTLRF